MSGIKLSDQHFALGDDHELAIHVPRATRRKKGIDQFSAVELIDEILSRPNNGSSVFAMLFKVAENLATLEHHIGEVKVVENESIQKILKELDDVREKQQAERLEFSRQVSLVNEHLSSKLNDGLAEIQRLLNQKIVEAQDSERKALNRIANPHETYTVKQLLGAAWKRTKNRE